MKHHDQRDRRRQGHPAPEQGDQPAVEGLAERGRELYWEGWRRNDQIRFGTFTNAWTGKQASDDYRVVFPIPQKALDTNPNFTQNAGY